MDSYIDDSVQVQLSQRNQVVMNISRLAHFIFVHFTEF